MASHRLVVAVEWIAGLILATIAGLTLGAVVLRYLFNAPVPDSFDISRLLMGAVVLWGIAAASYHNDHIKFDLVWSAVGPRTKRLLDMFATLVTFGAMSVLCVVLAFRVGESRSDHLTSSGLGFPLWPFHLFAWIGAALTVLLLVIRIARMLGPAPAVPGADGHR